MLVKAYIDTYKFPANITNCSNNYGPYQFPEKLIPLMINNALSGKKLLFMEMVKMCETGSMWKTMPKELIWSRKKEDFLKPII